MKALVVYDSFFGNTEQIAQAIADGVRAAGDAAEVDVVKVDQATMEMLDGLEMLVVGSPTRAFRASPNTMVFLKRVSPGALQGVRVGAFDTRIPADESTPVILRFLIKLFGWAAEPIGKRLTAKGGSQAAEPEGFYVTGTEGPLAEGELERAEAWGRDLAS